jgi:very-short-patch-repair endonuclease
MSKEIPFENSFASHEKAKYWSDKNLLKPNQVSLNSNKKYWFNCNCGHEINISLGNVNTGCWCSYCSNPPKKLCDKEDCKQCFEKSFVSHDKSKYWSDKNELKPRQIFKNSHNKYWFKCNICSHIFDTVLSSINNGIWCPYCNGNHKLCDNNDCNECFNKSFASHEKASFYSAENKLKARQVFKSSNKKFLLNCDKCIHSFDVTLGNVNTGFWCPYCANKKLCDNEECKECYNKSFASHEKAKYWSLENNLIPRQILLNSNKKYLFSCNCGHNFYSTLGHINGSDRWCPYCSNPPQKLCDKEDCKQCFEKSFASYEKSKFWYKDNKVLPRTIFKSANRKFIFKCNKEHIFTSALNHVVNNRWCPYCVNKTEQKLYDHLQPIYTNLQQQYKVDWCKNITYLPFDFILEEQKIIIELDGLQHFEQVSNWNSPDKVQERDIYKMKRANDNGYSVIRILQEDVFYDTYQWLEELKTNIETLLSENKVQNIFMCKDNEYSIFEVLE